MLFDQLGLFPFTRHTRQADANPSGQRPTRNRRSDGPLDDRRGHAVIEFGFVGPSLVARPQSRDDTRDVLLVPFLVDEVETLATLNHPLTEVCREHASHEDEVEDASEGEASVYHLEPGPHHEESAREAGKPEEGFALELSTLETLPLLRDVVEVAAEVGGRGDDATIVGGGHEVAIGGSQAFAKGRLRAAGIFRARETNPSGEGDAVERSKIAIDLRLHLPHCSRLVLASSWTRWYVGGAW